MTSKAKSRIEFIMMFTTFLWALEGIVRAENLPSSMNQHADFLLWLITGLVAMVAFFSVYLLTNINRNQIKLFERTDKLALEIARIQTEHRMNHGTHNNQAER